jgi:hypothetical protein
MPLTRFDALPDHSRLWVFAASRALTDRETAPLLASTDDFLVKWTAHKVQLASGRELRHNQFLFVAIDEAIAGASGCSIDALVHFMNDSEKSLGVRLTDNGAVWFRGPAGTVQCMSRPEFRTLAGQGAVGPDTVVFDNTIETVGALRAGKWETPLRRSWHLRAFFKDQFKPA